MVDQRKIGVVEINRLYDFLDGLQASGYTIDPRQIMALSDLLMALVARGESLDEAPLKTMIAPLICSTPLEQQDFYQRFDSWYSTLLLVSSGKGKIEGLTNELQGLLKPKKKRLLAISRTTTIWILVAAVVIVSFVWLALSNNNFFFYGVFIAVFTWIGWWIWLLYQENQYITREFAEQEPVYTKVPVMGYVQEIMPVMHLKPIISALRKRTQVLSTEVDVDMTIENALNRDNWLEIAYRQRQVVPEYVVLIDRKSRLDQQARFVQEILAKLTTDGVWLHQFEFNSDPRICFPLDRKDTPLRLKDLQSRYPDSRLLVFGDPNEFVDPLTGLLQSWLESLSYWRERAILTPDKLQKVLFEELQSRDFVILPMTFDGLASLVRAFETDNAPLQIGIDDYPPAPLTERPMRWTGRDMPPESEVKALISDVKTYLGENGFYWLCATAVYPELRWELTLHLGSTLKDDSGQSLLTPDALIRLSRLPWFRVGYMPDWIRSEILNSCTEFQEEKISDVLRQLISTVYQGKDFDLFFSRRESDSIGSRVRNLLFSMIRISSDLNDLNDYIFVKFLIKSKNKKISVALPIVTQQYINDRESERFNALPSSSNDTISGQGSIKRSVSTHSPSHYREEVLKPFFKYVKSGESFYVVGAPLVGKTRLMDFIMGDDSDALWAGEEVDRDWVKSQYLGEDIGSKIWLVRVDMNRMRHENDWAFQFYELLLHTLLLTCNRHSPMERIETLKTDLAVLDAQAVQSKDPLLAYRLFEMAVNMICQSYNIQICFLFDEFDDTYQAMPLEIFSQLRGIRDANKHRVSYILFLRNLPEMLRSPKENESFYELISRNMLGLGPYSAMDTFHIIGQLEKRRDYELNKENREWVWANSGGHPGLIQALFTLIKENSLSAAQMQNLEWLAKQEIIREEFRKIWHGLLEEEQDALKKIANSDQKSVSSSTGKLLLAKGIIKPSGNQSVALFTPLFRYWLE